MFGSEITDGMKQEIGKEKEEKNDGALFYGRSEGGVRK